MKYAVVRYEIQIINFCVEKDIRPDGTMLEMRDNYLLFPRVLVAFAVFFSVAACLIVLFCRVHVTTFIGNTNEGCKETFYDKVLLKVIRYQKSNNLVNK